jgi:hypothetical protein
MQQSIMCPKCGSPNALGQRFCWNCGTTLGTGCPNCGASLDPGARFCGNCGAQLPAMQQPGGWGQPPPPPQPGGWGQPPPPQQPGGWGQPPPPPQPGGWGPPPQQPGGWGQPPPGGMPQAGAWGQPVQRRKSGAGGLVILLIVLLIGLGTLGYFAFFSSNPPWAKSPSGSSSGTTITSAITEGPFPFHISSDNTTSTAKMEVRWKTDVLYKGQVEYGTDTSYGSTSEFESDFVKDHVVPLSGLQAATSYNYRIILKNQSDQEWTSGNFTFKTPGAE